MRIRKPLWNNQLETKGAESPPPPPPPLLLVLAIGQPIITPEHGCSKLCAHRFSKILFLGSLYTTMIIISAQNAQKNLSKFSWYILFKKENYTTLSFSFKASSVGLISWVHNNTSSNKMIKISSFNHVEFGSFPSQNSHLTRPPPKKNCFVYYQWSRKRQGVIICRTNLFNPCLSAPASDFCFAGVLSWIIQSNNSMEL